jgi:hypothetical protein
MLYSAESGPLPLPVSLRILAALKPIASEHLAAMIAEVPTIVVRIVFAGECPGHKAPCLTHAREEVWLERKLPLGIFVAQSGVADSHLP